MRTPPLWEGRGFQGAAAPFLVTMVDAPTTSTTPINCTICPSSKGLQIMLSTQRRRGWGLGGFYVHWSSTGLDMAEISCYDRTPHHVHRDAPPYTPIHYV